MLNRLCSVAESGAGSLVELGSHNKTVYSTEPHFAAAGNERGGLLCCDRHMCLCNGSTGCKKGCLVLLQVGCGLWSGVDWIRLLRVRVVGLSRGVVEGGWFVASGLTVLVGCCVMLRT